ncbi:hypothetical protein JTB14_002120 [Gonioctena quinquepunctata]|nr:hypothetical protein JTB14_002120 [Gonioctena quinquepunctata]
MLRAARRDLTSCPMHQATKEPMAITSPGPSCSRSSLIVPKTLPEAPPHTPEKTYLEEKKKETISEEEESIGTSVE